MRNFANGLCLVALTFSSHLAAASIPVATDVTGATIPSAAQIVDSAQNQWTLSDGVAYKNGKTTPSSGVILLLLYGGIVYQENIHHNWWLWDPSGELSSWIASSDPRVISPSGTTMPAATQIVDSELNVWTISAGGVYEKGQRTPSADVILLLYAKGIVYQENIHHDWWLWRAGAWVATAAPLLPSASGTAIPTAARIIDGELDVWTVSGGKVYENGALTPSSGVILLLFYDGSVYQENIHHNWWQWNGHAWISTPSDPRAGQPMAYVASCASPCSSENAGVTVIDTETNRVTATIPTAGMEVAIMAVTPDAKHVYAAGATGHVSDPGGGPGYATGTVEVIDTAQKSVVKSIPLPYDPLAIVASPDGSKIYVVGAGAGTHVTIFSAIDTSTNVVASTLNLPNFVGYSAEIAISPDGKRLYVPGLSGAPYSPPGIIYVIDTATNTVVSHFTDPPYQDFDGAAISPDNAKLYSNAYYTGGAPSLSPVIPVFDPATGAVTAKVPGVMTVEVFSPDSQHLYGVSAGYGAGLGGIGVIDTATDIPTTAVANILAPLQLAITPDGKHLYITDSGTASVLVADTATYTISTTIPVSGLGAIAIVPAH